MSPYCSLGRVLPLYKHLDYFLQELVLEVALPKATTARQLQLDISRTGVELYVPGVYRLHVPLPYPINEDKSRAKFDKDCKDLEVTLPLLPLGKDKAPITAVSGAPTTAGEGPGREQSLGGVNSASPSTSNYHDTVATERGSEGVGQRQCDM